MTDELKNSDDSVVTVPSGSGLVDIPSTYDAVDRSIRVAFYEADGSLEGTGFYEPNMKQVVGYTKDPKASIRHQAIDVNIKDADGDGIRDLRAIIRDPILHGFFLGPQPLIEMFPVEGLANA
tara:strand:- start:196827 stop:197192 length:366 start_codon:yes stop_codon:yes gene_type:complete